MPNPSHSGWDGPLALDFEGAVRDWVPELAVAVEPHVPIRTGLLRASNRYFIRSRGRVVEMRNKQPYAPAQYYGARPHVIAARNAQALRFKGRSGAYIFRKRVNHPGNPPNPWLAEGLDDALPKLAARLGWVPKARVA